MSQGELGPDQGTVRTQDKVGVPRLGTELVRVLADRPACGLQPVPGKMCLTFQAEGSPCRLWAEGEQCP